MIRIQELITEDFEDEADFFEFFLESDFKVSPLGYIVYGVNLNKEDKQYIVQSVVPCKDGELLAIPSKLMKEFYPNWIGNK